MDKKRNILLFIMFVIIIVVLLAGIVYQFAVIANLKSQIKALSFIDCCLKHWCFI